MFAADWALKRLCKFLLKRNLKHLLRTEIDLDQLELGKGSLELKEVLLNECYLSEQLSGSGWEVAAGLVGTVRVVVPLASFYSESIRIELEDVLLTLRPCRAAGSAEAACGPQQPDSPASPTEEPAAAMSDGVKLIAGGIESLLRRMRVQATGVAVRLEIPKPDGGSGGGGGGGGGDHHVVLVRLEGLQYGSSKEEAAEQAPPGDDPPSALRVSRRIAFSGLALEIEQPEPAAPASSGGGEGGPLPSPAVLLSGLGGGGISGLVQMHLSSGPQQRLHPGVAVSVQVESAQLLVHQQHALAAVGIVAALEVALGSRKPSSTPDEGPPSTPAAPPPDHHWGRQSFIQGLLLPDCEGLVADALTSSKLSAAPGDHAAESEEDEFFDAQSLLGSMQSLAMSAASLPGGGTEDLSDAALSKMHDLAASVRQVSTAGPLHWEFEAAVHTFGISLLYWSAADASGGGGRLSLACSQLHVEAKSEAGLFPFKCGVLSLRHLEISEQLPVAAAGAASREDPKLAARVPGSLPTSVPIGGGYPIPTFAGEYSFTSSSSSTSFTRTLDQLSDLQRATYSRLYGTTPQGSAVLLPLVRISPVLCCGTALTGSHTGSDIPALIAIASVTGQQDTLHIEAVTLPISIWTNLPFLERLLAFAEPICARAQEDPGTRLKGSAANPWTQDAKSELRREPNVAARPEPEPRLQLDLAIHVPKGCLIHGIGATSRPSELSYLAAEICTPATSAGLLHNLMSSLQGAVRLPDYQVVLDRLGEITAMLRIENTSFLSPNLRTSCLGRVERQPSLSATLFVSETALYAVNTTSGAPLSASKILTAGDEGLKLQADWCAHRLSNLSLLENAWDKLSSGLMSPTRPSEELAGHWESDYLDGLQFREQCVATAPLFVHLRAPSVHLDLSQASLAAIMEAADGILQLAGPQHPATGLDGGGTQLALLLECSLFCRLTAYEGGGETVYGIDGAGVQVFCASSLAGIPGAGAVIATIDGLTVDKDACHCLYRPDASLVEGGSPAAEAILLSRPKAGASPVASGRRFIIPTQTIAAVSLTGCTISTEPGEVSMDWLARLGSFFKGSAAEEANSGLCSTDWNVRLSSMAVSYETGLSAALESFGAVLLLGEASWRMTEGAARHHLTMRCLSLHAAALAGTLSHSSLGSRRDLAGTDLSAASYKRIGVESEISFDFPAAGGGGCWQLEVQNHLLSISLDPEGITLLSRLVDQIRASRPAAAPRERGLPGGDVVQDLASSVFIDGARWEGALEEEERFAAPSPSNLVEDFFAATSDSPAPSSFDFQVVWAEEGREREVDEGCSMWYASGGHASPPHILDEYVVIPLPHSDTGRAGRSALGILPEGYPTSLGRIIVHGANVRLAISGFDPRGSSGEVHLVLDRASVQVDIFRPVDEFSRRVAFSVEDVVMTDNLQHVDGKRAGADGPWRRTLGSQKSARASRDPHAAAGFANLVLNCVRPVGGDEEYRVSAALLPLRLELDQHCFAFFGRLKEHVEGLLMVPSREVGAQAIQQGLFMQQVEIQPFTVTIEYSPAAADIQALRQGNLLEMLNILPWTSVHLKFRQLTLLGMEGVTALGTAASMAWINDIAAHQRSAFVRGVAPINSLYRLGAAAAQLAKVSVEAYSNQGEGSASAELRRQLIRSVLRLIKAVVLEAVSLTAAVAKRAEAAAQHHAPGGAAEATVASLRRVLLQARDAVGARDSR